MAINNELLNRALPWLTIIEKMGRQKSYKPILLLSVIAEIETGFMTENSISLTESVLRRFIDFYKEIGNKKGEDQAWLPYYYLKRDVWNLQWRNDSPRKRPSTNRAVIKHIKSASFKGSLFELLKDESIRDLVKERLYLKAEEDIRLKDPRNNETFNPPSNIASILVKHFGQIIVLPKETHIPTSSDPITLNFAQEKLLQEFLANRWEEIQEFRSRNLQIFGGPDIGIEYDTKSAGRIDILAEDKFSKDLTVIELKRGISGEQHLGQLLRYMGWARTKLAGQKKVFGLLIASGFQESIKFAIKELKTVSLMEYDLIFKLHQPRF